MAKTTFKLTDRQQIDLFLYSMRYALGRRTAAPSDVADHIVAHWEKLNDRAQMLILRDLKQAIEEDDRQPGRLGDRCDRAVWDELLKKLEK